jgi:hypothetical protein
MYIRADRFEGMINLLGHRESCRPLAGPSPSTTPTGFKRSRAVYGEILELWVECAQGVQERRERKK